MIPEAEIKYLIQVSIQDMPRPEYRKMINGLNVQEKAEKAKIMMETYEAGFRACLKLLGEGEQCLKNLKLAKKKQNRS